jgi:hypothetical protein
MGTGTDRGVVTHAAFLTLEEEKVLHLLAPWVKMVFCPIACRGRR